MELLAPAGSFESMKAAVAAGADAVYMGGTRFGARAYADNPDQDRLLEAIDYVHLHGRRLYMTVNTLFKEQELGELYEYMLPYYEAGLDGVIVQDLGALAFMKEHFPGLELHGSTQMTITSLYGARLLKSMGCCRVVPARELSLEEIRRIHDEAGVEIETFIHGALCYCYSGQCLMSSLIGGRSGNRGRCAQPCRLPYRVTEADGKPVKGGGKPSYVMSLKDLCTLDLLPQLAEAGIYSLKIEGRMKSPRYTAGVVRIYRKYIDRYMAAGAAGYKVEPEDKKELLELFDRGGFTSGYYEKHNGRDMVALKEKPEFRQGNQELFDYLDRNYVEKELKEEVEGRAFLAEGQEAVLQLRCRGKEAEVKGQLVQSAQNQPVTEDKIRKQLSKTGGTPFVFKKLEILVEGKGFMPVQGLNELRRKAFDALYEEIMNDFRRKRTDAGEAVPETEGQESEPAANAGEQEDKPAEAVSGTGAGEAAGERKRLLSVSVEEPEQLAPVLACREVSRVYLASDGFEPGDWESLVRACHQAGKECWLLFPQIFRTHAMEYFGKHWEKLERAFFDGFLLGTLEEVQWLKDRAGGTAEVRIPVALDASVYAWNSLGVRSLGSLEPSFITMPWELNSRELKPVLKACSREGILSEMIIYGRAPMMVSAQCIARTVKGCSGRRSVMVLKDRTGADLPVKNRCQFCYNTVFNSVPLSLLGSEEDIRRLGPGTLRLAFTVESGEETAAVLEAFSGTFIRGLEPEEEGLKRRGFTRGHFRRGVE